MKTICLNMIVKNEASVILDCLESVKDLIDFWVISDTGSTDGTQKLIQQFFNDKNIPGVLLEQPWKNFEYNRNLSLNNAIDKGDYCLFIDADDKLIIENKEIFKKNLNSDAYYIKIKHGNLEFFRPQLVKNAISYKWEGVLHEYINLPPCRVEYLEGIYIKTSYNGARSKNPNKFLDDAKVLEEAILSDPNNQRYHFYLGQSYKDCGQIDASIKAYKEVLPLKGYIQEKYISCINIGRLLSAKNLKEEALYYFLKSTQYDKNRIEGIVEATTILRQNDMHDLVCMFYDRFKDYNKNIQNILFKEIELYKNYLEFNFTVSSYYVGRKDEGKKILKNLLEDKNTSYIIMEQAKKNLVYFDL